jgi:hypothetical protein
MLLTLVRENGPALPVELAGGEEASDPPALALLGGGAKSFTIEVPYTPQAASVLAQVLLSWRLAKPGRAVFLLLPDEPELEIGALSPSRIEWMLPVVTRVAIIERPGPRAAPDDADAD